MHLPKCRTQNCDRRDDVVIISVLMLGGEDEDDVVFFGPDAAVFIMEAMWSVIYVINTNVVMSVSTHPSYP